MYDSKDTSSRMSYSFSRKAAGVELFFLTIAPSIGLMRDDSLI